MIVKAKGSPGSWFATLATGEVWPCVHRKHCIPNSPKGFKYLDPKAVPGTKVWDKFIGAIQLEKRVILTEEDELQRRQKYLHAWVVDNVIVENGELRFDFTEKLFDVKRG